MVLDINLLQKLIIGMKTRLQRGLKHDVGDKGLLVNRLYRNEDPTSEGIETLVTHRAYWAQTALSE